METIPQPTPENNHPVPPVVNPPRGLFGTKMPSTIAFLIASLLFFMPFIDIKCNNMSLKKISGVELATGFSVKSPGSNSMLDGFDTGKSTSSASSHDSSPFALAALCLAVLGLVLVLIDKKASVMGGMVAGILGVVALIILAVQFSSDVKSKEKVSSSELGDVKLSVDFTLWFYLVILLFAGAAWACYQRAKNLTTNGL